MTRETALAALMRYAAGLTADPEGVRTLQERIGTADEPELLQAVLVEVGAELVIERASTNRRARIMRAVEKHAQRQGS